MQRRKFMKTSANALTGAAMFSIIPSTVLGKSFGSVAPSDKVILACCGIGHRGGGITNSLFDTGHANIVALCDVDMGAEHTLEVIEMFPDVPRFKDFREMFDKMGDKIEAVSVGTPDFSHFPTFLKKWHALSCFGMPYHPRKACALP